MKVTTIIDYTTPCLWTCLGKGVEGITKYLNIPVQTYERLALLYYDKPAVDEEDIILIIEAGIVGVENQTYTHDITTLSILKEIFPNSKVVILSSDAIFYIDVRKEPQVDFKYVDLFLDVDPRCVEHYQKEGIKADLWMWTLSDWLFGCARGYYLTHKLDQYEKKYDFIGVYNQDSLTYGYRKNLLDYIKQNNLTFTSGGCNGTYDGNLLNLFNHYGMSKITLGTTSHALHPDFHSFKGFRDWIGPVLGSMLIYDDFAQNYYKDIIPYYNYKTFDRLIDIATKVNPMEWLPLQLEWAYHNTIDKQLVRLLLAHNLISQENIIDKSILL